MQKKPLCEQVEGDVSPSELGSSLVTLPEPPRCLPAARMLEHLWERTTFPTSMAHPTHPPQKHQHKAMAAAQHSCFHLGLLQKPNMVAFPSRSQEECCSLPIFRPKWTALCHEGLIGSLSHPWAETRTLPALSCGLFSQLVMTAASTPLWEGNYLHYMSKFPAGSMTVPAKDLLHALNLHCYLCSSLNSYQNKCSLPFFT